MDIKTIHKLQLEKPFAKTACGQRLIAIYTPSYTAMLDTAGADPIRVSHVDSEVTCKKCLADMGNYHQSLAVNEDLE